MNPLNWKSKKGNSFELPCVPEHYEESSDMVAVTPAEPCANNTPLQTSFSRPKEMESRRRAFSDFALYGKVHRKTDVHLRC